jgi:Domain of unknown function (DUF3870)
MSREVLVAGYARTPERSPAHATNAYLTIGVRVEIETHKVLAVSSTMGVPISREWVVDHLLGANLLDPSPQFVRDVRSDYWGLAKGTLIQCYRDLVRRYRQGLQREGLLPRGLSDLDHDEPGWSDDAPED